MNEVEIAGAGVVSSVGVDLLDTWKALHAGRTGISRRRTPLGTVLRMGSEIPVDVRSHVRHRRTVKLMAVDARLGLLAATEALAAASLDDSILSSDRTLLSVAAAPAAAGLTGQIQSLAYMARESDARRLTARRYFELAQGLNPIESFRDSPDMVAAHIAINLGITTATHILTSGAGAAASALVDAVEAVRCGVFDHAVAGGAEDGTTDGALLLLAEAGLLGRGRESGPPRPVRIVPSSGAGFLVLRAPGAGPEPRGARVRILGHAEVSAGKDDPVRAHRSVTERALREAGLAPRDLAVAHLHLTPLGRERPDRDALIEVLGPLAPRVAVFSSRPALGHALAGAPAMDLALTALMLLERKVPPLPPVWARRLRPLRVPVPGPACLGPGCGLVLHHWPGGATAAFVLQAARGR